MGHRIGRPSWFVLAFGLGACWYAWEHWKAPAPSAAPVHQVVVRETVTRVVHAGMPGWGMVVIAVVALGVLCALGRGA